ncbi:MAG: hypothetical protein FWG66_11270 [Spirochaetes bacterium]|nr:hypothetical protein [Spirochaetota bacterium]
MARSSFNFDGGEYVTTMGAAWFVSYSYYSHADKLHRNWERVTTHQGMRSVFNRTKKYHQDWLRRILEMNERNLSKNTIGLEPAKVKNMAKELLEKLNGT